MSTRGYDSRAIKLPKSIKRQAARMLNNHQRNQFVRAWVGVCEAEVRSGKRSRDKKD